MSERLAMHGGAPVRAEPFGPGHDFGDDDIAALTEVVRSGHVGKGPKVDAFERAFAARHGVKHAIAVTSGTAAMHVCIGAINPEPGDEDDRDAVDGGRDDHGRAAAELRAGLCGHRRDVHAGSGGR